MLNNRVKAYLQLTRPANLLTAVSDVWAGVALSGYFLLVEKAAIPVVLLSVSSVFLYAGGVVFNDVCDAELDAIERPERPIPSGLIAKTSAAYFSALLFIIGIALAAVTGIPSGVLAVLIAISCLVYDRWGKPHPFFGPLNMGLCRGLNLLLGMSLLSLKQTAVPWPAIVPVLYIAAVTLISRGEVHGGRRSAIWTAFFLYVVVIMTIAAVGASGDSIFITAIFLLLFAAFIFPPLFRALTTLSGPFVGKAVKAGVLGLILMDAAWVAAAGGGWMWAIITALLLPLSIVVARRFAVT